MALVGNINGNIRGLEAVKVTLKDSTTHETIDITHSLKNGWWEFVRPVTGKYDIEFDGRGTSARDYLYGIEVVDMTEFESSDQFLNDTPPSGVFADAGSPLTNFTSRLETRVEIQWIYTQDATDRAHGFIVRWEHGASSGQAVTTASPSRKLDSTIRKTTIEIPADDYITIKVYAYFSGKSASNEDSGYQHASWVDSQPVALASLSGWDSEADFLQGGAAKLHSDGYLELGTAIGNYAKIDASHPTYRIWVGHTDPTLAPFSVEKDGALVAAGGKAVFNADGSGTLGVDAISWTDGGEVTFSGWVASAGKLVGGNAANEYTGLQSGAGATKTFFAGADDADGANAQAYITAAGDAYFGGNIILDGVVTIVGYLPLAGGTMDDGAILRIDSIYARDSDGLTLADDAGNLGVFIKDGGNVGIGTDSPEERLHVEVADSTLYSATTPETWGQLQIENTDSTNGNAAGIRLRSYQFDIGITAVHTDAGNVGRLAISMDRAGDDEFEALTILSTSGNVGMGTNSPLVGLHVKGEGVAHRLILQDDTDGTIVQMGSADQFIPSGVAGDLGIRSEAGILFAASGVRAAFLHPSGKFGIGSFNPRALLTIADEQDIGSQTFSAGWAGSGWDLDYTNSEYVLELDTLFVRGALNVYELIINQLSAVNGGLVISAGNGRVASVTGSPSTEQITFQDPEDTSVTQFAPGDILLIQNVNLDSTTLVKRIVREVNTISGMTVTCKALGDAPTDAGEIKAGDVIVVIGNTKGGSPSVNVLSDAEYSGTVGWFSGSAIVTLSYDSGDVGHLTTVRIEATGTTNAYTSNLFALVTGKDYIVEFDYKTISTNKSTHSFRFVVGAASRYDYEFPISTTWAHIRKVVTESDLSSGVFGDITALRMFLQPATGLATDEMLIDNISIRVAGTVRDALVFISSTDAYGPYTMIMDEVDSWAAWKDPSKIKAVMGNLENKYGYDTEVYGFAAGEYEFTNGSTYITVDPTDGITIKEYQSGWKTVLQANGSTLSVGTGFVYTASSETLVVAGWTTTSSTFEKLDGSNTGVKLDADNAKIQVGNLDEQHIDLNGADGSVVWYKSDGAGGSTEAVRIDDNIFGSTPGIRLSEGAKIYMSNPTGHTLISPLSIFFQTTVSPPYNVGSLTPQFLSLGTGSSQARFSDTQIRVDALPSASAGTSIYWHAASGEIKKLTSSARYKENIKPIGFNPTPKIEELQIRSFNYIGDSERTIGLIAEEVEVVNTHLVNYDKKGRPDSIRNHNIMMLMLAEIQKLRAEVNVLKSIN